jgi:hypothetical protein
MNDFSANVQSRLQAFKQAVEPRYTKARTFSDRAHSVIFRVLSVTLSVLFLLSLAMKLVMSKQRAAAHESSTHSTLIPE